MLTASSFAHYFIGKHVFDLSEEELYSVIYLQVFAFSPLSFFHCQLISDKKVSSCPHFMIFGTRVTQPFWTNKPSLSFFCAIVGTQIFAMFFAIYGVLSGPIGWGWGVSIMVISVAYFCLMDMVKVCIPYYFFFFLVF